MLELKVKESPRNDETPMMYYNIGPDPLSRMNDARRKLEEAILRYETIIEQIEELWETKVTQQIYIVNLPKQTKDVVSECMNWSVVYFRIFFYKHWFEISSRGWIGYSLGK